MKMSSEKESPAATPTKPRSSALRVMKTPGPTIPTPMHPTFKSVGEETLVSEGPEERKDQIQTEICPPPTQPSMTVFEDEAFLPDDYLSPKIDSNRSSNKENLSASEQSCGNKLFSLAEVQAKIAEAVQKAQQQWTSTAKQKIEDDFEAKLSKLRLETEQKLEEHGNSWTAEHQDELNALRSRLQESFNREKHNLIKNHERELESLKISKEMSPSDEVETLKQALEQSEEKAAMEKEELSKRLQELEEKNEQLSNQSSKGLQELQDAHQQITENLKREWEAAMQEECDRLYALHKSETEELHALSQTLQRELTLEKQRHEEEILRVKDQRPLHSANNEEMKELQKTLADLDAKLRSVAVEHEGKLDAMCMIHQEEKHQLTVGLQDDFKAEREALEREREMALRTSEDAQSQLNSLAHEFSKIEEALAKLSREKAEELASLERNHQEEIEAVRKEARASLAKQGDKAKNGRRLQERVFELEALLKSTQAEYEQREREARESHASQFDEVLAQLDLVEAEHKEKNQELADSVQQKDAIIAALGVQLADATKRASELDSERERHIEEIKAAQEQADVALETSKALEESMALLKVEHAREIQEEMSRRATACDEVREEMIAAAKEQFAEANQHYMNLKQEYESNLTKLTKLDRDYKGMKKENSRLKERTSAKEAEMAAELAQAKAALATSEANAARKLQEYNTGVAKYEEVLLQNETRHEELLAKYNSVQASLAATLDEKQKLMMEFQDLNAVCEELMEQIENDHARRS